MELDGTACGHPTRNERRSLNNPPLTDKKTGFSHLLGRPDKTPRGHLEFGEIKILETVAALCPGAP